MHPAGDFKSKTLKKLKHTLIPQIQQCPVNFLSRLVLVVVLSSTTIIGIVKSWLIALFLLNKSKITLVRIIQERVIEKTIEANNDDESRNGRVNGFRGLMMCVRQINSKITERITCCCFFFGNFLRLWFDVWRCRALCWWKIK